MNVAGVLRQPAVRRSARIALRAGNREVSYRELDAASARVALLLLEDGLQPGERVVLLLPNVPEFAAAYYGVLRAGGVAVPLDPYLTRTEIAAIVQDAASRHFVVWRGAAALGARERGPVRHRARARKLLRRRGSTTSSTIRRWRWSPTTRR